MNARYSPRVQRFRSEVSASQTRAAARQLAVDLAGAATDDDDKAAAVWAVVSR